MHTRHTKYFQISRFISSATCTFWLSIYRGFFKFWHLKRVAGYYFYTWRIVIHITISSTIRHYHGATNKSRPCKIHSWSKKNYDNFIFFLWNKRDWKSFIICIYIVVILLISLDVNYHIIFTCKFKDSFSALFWKLDWKHIIRMLFSIYSGNITIFHNHVKLVSFLIFKQLYYNL